MKRRKIRRNMSEKKLMKLKRSLRKRAKKLRLGKKRTGAYVFGTLRRVRGNGMRTHNKEGQKLYFVLVKGHPLKYQPPFRPGIIYYTKGWAIKKARVFGGEVISVADYVKYQRDTRREAIRLGYMPKEYLSKSERRLVGNPEEYARQIPRESRPMKGRGFSSKFDTSAGSTHKDLENFIAGGRDKWARTIGANTVVRRYNDGSIGVILYQTRILHYHPNGSVDVNFGGYMTPTTFSRINSLIPYGWRVRKKGGKLALENSWGQRAVVRQPRAGEEYSIKLTEDKAYLID